MKSQNAARPTLSQLATARLDETSAAHPQQQALNRALEGKTSKWIRDNVGAWDGSRTAISIEQSSFNALLSLVSPEARAIDRLSGNDPDAVQRMNEAARHLERAFGDLGLRASVKHVYEPPFAEAETMQGYVRVTIQSPALKARIAEQLAS